MFCGYDCNRVRQYNRPRKLYHFKALFKPTCAPVFPHNRNGFNDTALHSFSHTF